MDKQTKERALPLNVSLNQAGVLVPKGEKSLLILLCSSRIWVRFFFFFFFFDEAGYHFISLIISLSTTSHKEIANKFFLPFVVGLFFRSALYSPIFYIPSASLPCKVQQWLFYSLFF